MKRHLHWLLLAAFLATLVFDAVVWAGAAALPGVGVNLHRGAKREAPLTYLYMTIGRPLAVGALGEFGRRYAADALANVAREIELKPELAMEIAHGPAKGPRHATLRWMHFAPVVLFCAWLVAYLFRPKSVHLGLRRR